MQIRSIALYNDAGSIRRWDFKLGKVNIITGARRSGKTALLRIVQYCLGKGECEIPKGVIRNSVAWYGVLFQIDGSRVFVARRNPPAEAETSSDIYFEVGSDIDVPQFSALRKVVDIDGLVSTLGDLLGIGDNLNIPDQGQTRDPLEANLKHTWFYLFQLQDEVTAPSFLFHNEKENSFMPQTIKDTLPYFLGVPKTDHFAKQEERKRIRKEVRRIQRRLTEAEWIRGEAMSRGKELVAEAQDLGIYENVTIPEDQDTLVRVLNRILNWKPADLSDASGLTLSRLQDERAALLTRFRELNEGLESAVGFSVEQERYLSEASDQRIRLESIGLLKKHDDKFHCPLCDTELSASLPSAGNIMNSFDEITAQLDTVSRERARLDKVIADRRNSLGLLRQQIRDTTSQINAVLQQNAITLEKRELENRRLAAVGRVSLYIETLGTVDEDGYLNELLLEYEGKLAVLEEELNEDEFEIALNSTINRISAKMTDWSDNLDYEYASAPQRFDYDHLTLIADAESGPIPMKKMGGGTNALSCHFLVLFGFHHWFKTRSRPVPHFLMLDQISQVYYPPDTQGKSIEADSKRDPTEDERYAVRQMYRWLFDRVSELGEGFQLIITDHADINEPWFQKGVIDRWRAGNRMIPSEWIDAAEFD